MTKEEIQKNSEHWYNKYKDAEKRITELENKIADNKANCDLAIEGKDVKIKELEETIANLKEQVQSQVEATIELDKENAELKKWQKDTIKARGNDYVDWSRMKDQLTKATELLKKLILEVRGYEEINGYDTCEPVQEAEQFLNSEVEK